jgi:hypothetical protein
MPKPRVDLDAVEKAFGAFLEKHGKTVSLMDRT